jgi:hypothetical protein
MIRPDAVTLLRFGQADCQVVPHADPL